MIRRLLVLASFVALAGSLVLGATPSPAGAAEKKGKVVDLFWTAPGLSTFPATSVALLPVATYDANAEARRLIETAVGQTFRTSGHRWVSSALSRDFLTKAGGDSMIQALNVMLLEHPRVDSVRAPGLSRIVRARALLTVRVEQFEQRLIEVGQSGRPATTVQLKMALVDSTGSLLWTASGGETIEGPYQDGGANPIGVKASGLNNTPVTAQGGAADFREVLAKLMTRWAEAFPKKPGPAATGAAGTPAAADSSAAH